MITKCRLKCFNGEIPIYSSWFNKTVKIEVVRNDSVDIEAQKKIITDISDRIISNENIESINYHVNVIDNYNESPILKRFDREVNLTCEGKVVCNAKSDVIIRDHGIIQLVENEGVGIGQLFR